MRVLSIVVCLAVGFISKAQGTFPSNGAPFNPGSMYALMNATIHHPDGPPTEHGTLLVQNGLVSLVGANVKVPAGSVIIDATGKHIYPSFIDIFSDYGMPAVPKPERRRGPQPESNEKGAYAWNQAIRAHSEAQRVFVHQAEKADELRKAGFGVVLTCPKDGIVRGSGALVALNSGGKENKSILNGHAAALYSFSKGSSSQDYPTSLAGSIALLRQTFYDADWYASQKNRTEHNISLEAVNGLRKLPALFDAGDKYMLLRAAKVGEEFKMAFVMRCGGNEYQRIAEVKAAGVKCAVPLNFPDAYDVEDPYDLESVSLAEMKHWELAPVNPASTLR